MNHYANKKSAAESMLDIALLMANASQLKAVVEQGPSFAFYVPLVVLISISLVLQIGVGVLLIFLGRSPGGGSRATCSPCWHLLASPGTGAHHLAHLALKELPSSWPSSPRHAVQEVAPPLPPPCTLVFVLFCFVF